MSFYKTVNLPNMISLGRLLSVPVIVWMISKEFYGMAFVAFLVAGFSDALDGILARVLHARTLLGSYLDPLADKVLLGSLVVVLGFKDLVPLWLVIGVVFRDVLIVGGTCLLFILGKSMGLKPLGLSKLNTGLQVLMISCVLAKQAMLWVQDGSLYPLFILVGGSTALSGGAYVLLWVKHVNEGGDTHEILGS